MWHHQHVISTSIDFGPDMWHPYQVINVWTGSGTGMWYPYQVINTGPAHTILDIYFFFFGMNRETQTMFDP